MEAKSRHASLALRLKAQTQKGAFTYVEVMMALSVLGLITGSAFTTMTQVNKYAVSNRVSTCAQTVAQNQIDAFLTAGPFYPTANPALIPTELATTTTSGATTNGVTIYTDTATSGIVVTGSLTRTVVDLGLTQTTNGVTQPLNARRLGVTLNYTFGGKNYSIVMSTLRASDS